MPFISPGTDLCISINMYKHMPVLGLMTAYHNVRNREQELNLQISRKTRCVCETLMPPKHTSFEKHNPDI